MELLKSYYRSIIEVVIAIILGMIATHMIIKKLYELIGIQFIGNVNAIYFSTAFLVYCLGMFIKHLVTKKRDDSKNQLNKFSFWAIFLLSVIILIIPIIKGKIPY